MQKPENPADKEVEAPKPQMCRLFLNLSAGILRGHDGDH